MVIGVLHKKLLRNMRRQWAQTLAVVAVVACGIAAYICVYSAYLNLGLTRDTYYAQNRLADFEIMVERVPETALYKLATMDGVRKVRGRIVEDVNVDIDDVDEPRIGRMISMPNPRRPVINDIVIMEGRYFSEGAQDEVILSDRFATENNLKPGDRFQISVDNKKYSLRVVGLALSPEYVYMIRNIQELFPNPEKFGILWVPEDFAESAMNMQAARNNIVGMVDAPDDMDALLDDAENLLDSYGVFAKVKREDFISNSFLTDEINGLGVTARVIPTLFLGIAALILLILLNRMVRTERTQIGLLKAFGYGNMTIALHYIQYALLLSVSGCLIGFALGQWMSSGLIKLYVEFYQFPILESRVYFNVLGSSIGLSIVFGIGGALAAALQAIRILPAESMRPEAPATAHQLWVEKIGFFWRRIGFTGKMVIRNIGRTPFRAMLNVFGTAISTGFLVLGFFSIGSMDFGLRFQFQEVQREDVRLSFQYEHGKKTLYDVQRLEHVRRAEPLLEYVFEARNEWRKKDILVIGLTPGGELQKVINFSGEVLTVPDEGLVLSGRLANQLGVSVGDSLILKPRMGRITREKTVKVTAITQQFLGTAAYMDIGALSRVLQESFLMNAALLRIEEGSEKALNKHFKDVAAVSAVNFTKDAYTSMKETIGASMKMTNIMLLLFAGVIAFSIIYNVTAVSLAERERELASLRVLGLTQAEVGSILYNENLVLGMLGAVLGIPLGLAICRMIVNATSSDLYTLPFHIDSQMIVLSVVVILVCVILANVAVWWRVRNLDMIEVLKERE